MGAKCYEIRLVARQGPWGDGRKLWERVPTANGRADRWDDVALRLLAAGKYVACKTCGVLPGTTWVEGKEVDVSQGRRATQDYVCDKHSIREGAKKPGQALTVLRGVLRYA